MQVLHYRSLNKCKQMNDNYHVNSFVQKVRCPDFTEADWKVLGTFSNRVGDNMDHQVYQAHVEPMPARAHAVKQKEDVKCKRNSFLNATLHCAVCVNN